MRPEVRALLNIPALLLSERSLDGGWEVLWASVAPAVHKGFARWALRSHLTFTSYYSLS